MRSGDLRGDGLEGHFLYCMSSNRIAFITTHITTVFVSFLHIPTSPLLCKAFVTDGMSTGNWAVLQYYLAYLSLFIAANPRIASLTISIFGSTLLTVRRVHHVPSHQISSISVLSGPERKAIYILELSVFLVAPAFCISRACVPVLLKIAAP